MSTYMLISCGTSVLTNGVDAATRDHCSRLANERELDPEDRNWLDRHREATSRRLQTGGWTQARRQSAELNSLAAFFPTPPRNSGRPDHLVLLHTDTDLGRAAAQILKDWLDAQGYEARLHTTPGLATRSLEDFQASLSELVRWAWEEIPGYREAGFRIVFNLTGGFKGVLGFLQVLATLMADETIYLFEGSEQLLRIPRLPVKMAAEETVRQHLDTFRRMSVLDSVPADKCAGLPETLYFTHEGQAGLTPWGEMVWNQARHGLYAEEVLPPLSFRVRLTEAFIRSAKALAPSRRRSLNTNLDQLARMFETPGNPNPQSLRFHTLTGPPVEGSTHEFYAGTEGGRSRCFGRFDGRTFLVERLDKHL